MRYIPLALFMLPWLLHAQDLHYAKTTIEQLASQGMHGRGYVKDGHRIAADFIASEFKHLGLQSFSRDYMQSFPLKVNTFPGKMTLRVGHKKLAPGRDFLVHPSSPGIRGVFKVLHLKPDTLLSNSSEWVKLIKETRDVIVLDNSGIEDLSAEDQSVLNGMTEVLQFNRELQAPAVIIITGKKLTWGTSQNVGIRPVFFVSSRATVNLDWAKVQFNVHQEWLEEVMTQNVIGLIPGRRTDSVVMVTAHYDHLGRMGRQTYLPGANDNASGVAMLLSLARDLSFGEKPEFGVLFVAFGGEEAGLEGSKFYVNRPVYPLRRIKFLINLDIVGTGEEGIMVVNGSVYRDQFQLMTGINDRKRLVPVIKSRGKACNSDHCAFQEKGVPCFFVYTLGGIQAYHDIDDRPETLPLTEFEDLLSLIKEFIRSLN